MNDKTLIIEVLCSILPTEDLLVGDDISEKYHQDWSGEKGGEISAVVMPRNTETISKVLKTCNELGCPVVPQGGLTGLAGGATPVEGCVVISMERMKGIIEIDGVSGTMTVWAGTPLQVVQEVAEEAGFFFALDLGARGSCQIGGNIATNAGGNRVIRYGMTRDLVLGLEVVLADGTILPMLNKMVKNNAGPDLKQLFIGSEGTLGIITKAVVKLHPKVNGANTAFVALDNFTGVEQLLVYAQQQLSGQISAFEVMWQSFYKEAVTEEGIRAPLSSDYPVYVLMEQQSANPSMQSGQFEAVLEYALEKGWVIDAAIAQTHSDAESFWKLRDSIAELLQRYAPTINFDISFPISSIGHCAEILKEIMNTRFVGIRAMFFGHVGDGNIHVVVGPVPDDTVALEIEAAFYEVVRENNGSVSAEHGIGLHKKPWLSYSRSSAEIQALKLMKQALDPKNILNPGKVQD
ncbi:FAD-linked oxidase [Oligella sp. HMSC05A10]|uniref:FAD-binding oxidoreductase n=1 Tax=Oligella sp. HMSC05A10 TaxID=1581112 RepID=UPI0008A5D99E|nr:FAD-binding oxidoreductase [Oligella sp. HMSC05A10]OFS85614.1 FAD-linked oxidase [Oligella sp. HMSC05A10]